MNHRIVRVAQPRGGLSYGIQNGLELGRRACDYSEDLGRRRLLLQSLSQ